MQQTPRTESELHSNAQRIQERWQAIRRTELKPMQFHIGHGLLLITACAVVLGVVRSFVVRGRSDEAVALQIESGGGSVTWTRQLNGGAQITGVHLDHRYFPQALPDLLRAISQLHQLQSLSLQGCRLVDTDITTWTPPQSLTRIRLGQNPITDASVLHLARAGNLEAIDLSGTAITDVSLKALGTCANLTDLNLSETAISNRGLKSLNRLKRLRNLDLSDTRVSDIGVPHLSVHSQLLRLDLSNTDVSSAGVATLNAVLPNQPVVVEVNGNGP